MGSDIHHKIAGWPGTADENLIITHGSHHPIMGVFEPAIQDRGKAAMAHARTADKIRLNPICLCQFEDRTCARRPTGTDARLAELHLERRVRRQSRVGGDLLGRRLAQLAGIAEKFVDDLKFVKAFVDEVGDEGEEGVSKDSGVGSEKSESQK